MKSRISYQKDTEYYSVPKDGNINKLFQNALCHAPHMYKYRNCTMPLPDTYGDCAESMAGVVWSLSNELKCTICFPINIMLFHTKDNQ